MQEEFTKTIQADSKLEADRQWNVFAADVIQGKALAAGKKRMTLQEFYEYYKQHHIEVNNEVTTALYYDNLLKRIEPALGHLYMDKIEPRHILSFMSQLRDEKASANNTPLSPNAIRKYYDCLKTLFKKAKLWDFVTSNPIEKVTPPKRVRVQKKILHEEDMSEFLGELDSLNNLKYKIWVIMAFSTGLRREEIFGLQWQDINFEKRTLNVSRAIVYVHGQGLLEKDLKTDGSYRTLAMPPTLVRMLEDYKAEKKAAAKRKAKRRKIVTLEDPVSPEKWIFTSRCGEKVGHPHSFNSFLRRFCEGQDITKISPHVLRHMMGSYLLNSGIDLAAVSEKLGHANKSFTANTYIHALQSAEQASADTMQNILDTLSQKQKKTGPLQPAK